MRIIYILPIIAILSGCAGTPTPILVGKVIHPKKTDNMACETERQMLNNNETLEKLGK